MGTAWLVPILLYRDRLIPCALVTVAIPAQATSLRQAQDFDPSLVQDFDWQLGGPFSGGVRTGITPFPGSLKRRINAYSSSSTLFGVILSC